MLGWTIFFPKMATNKPAIPIGAKQSSCCLPVYILVRMKTASKIPVKSPQGHGAFGLFLSEALLAISSIDMMSWSVTFKAWVGLITIVY